MAARKQYGVRTTADEVIEGHDLKGKDVIVTGGASGIGVETVRVLAKAGARVVICARDLKKADQVAADIKKSTGNNLVEVEELELGSLKSINAFVARYLAKKRPLHILILNAGIMMTPKGTTEDGFELQFGTNHVGHHALTVGLLPALKTAKKSRVVVLSSIAHRNGDINFDDVNFKTREYSPIEAYGQSKTANALFAVALTRRYAKDGIYANSVMPGFIMTGLQKHLPKEVMISFGLLDDNGNPDANFKSIEQGAATTIWAAVAPELENRGGLYLEDCQAIKEVSLAEVELYRTKSFKEGYLRGYLAYAVDPDRADKLWDLTEKLIKEASTSSAASSTSKPCFFSSKK